MTPSFLKLERVQRPNIRWHFFTFPGDFISTWKFDLCPRKRVSSFTTQTKASKSALEWFYFVDACQMTNWMEGNWTNLFFIVIPENSSTFSIETISFSFIARSSHCCVLRRKIHRRRYHCHRNTIFAIFSLIRTFYGLFENCELGETTKSGKLNIVLIFILHERNFHRCCHNFRSLFIGARWNCRRYFDEKEYNSNLWFHLIKILSNCLVVFTIFSIMLVCKRNKMFSSCVTLSSYHRSNWDEFWILF